MALPATGPISMRDINLELNKREIALISLNDADVRNLAGVPAGMIAMGELRGKSLWIETWSVSINKTLSQSGETSFNQTFEAFIGDSIKTIKLNIYGVYQTSLTQYVAKVEVNELQAPYSIQMLVNTVDGLRINSLTNNTQKTFFEKAGICDLKIISLEITKSKS